MKRILTLLAVAGLLSSTAALAHEGYDKALQAYSCVDYQKAYGLFKTYAAQGHSLSQYMVGIMAEQGQGTDVDLKLAFDSYMNAAKQGLPDAYFALADMYAKGTNVAKDPVQAYAWFDLARQGGHKLAGDMLDSLAQALGPDQIAQAKKMGSDWMSQIKK
jgi:hypothetical protein